MLSIEELMTSSGIDPVTMRRVVTKRKTRVKEKSHSQDCTLPLNGHTEARMRYQHALVNDPASHVPADLIKPDWSRFIWDHWEPLNAKFPNHGVYAVLLDGPRGTTKTTLGYAYAAFLGRPLLVVNCQPDMTPEALLGCQQIKDGTSYWQPGLLQIAAECDAVVLFDEYNLMPSGVMASLNPITDGVQKGIFNPHTCKRVHWPNPRIIFAVNSGYAGTRTIQEAFKDRCETLLARYLTAAQEEKLLKSRTGINETEAKFAVKVANAVRKAAEGGLEFDLSPRALIRHCQLMILGMERSKAWTQAVMNRIGWTVVTEAIWTAVAELSRSIGNYQIQNPGSEVAA